MRKFLVRMTGYVAGCAHAMVCCDRCRPSWVKSVSARDERHAASVALRGTVGARVVEVTRA
jgi:hypothetical protein